MKRKAIHFFVAAAAVIFIQSGLRAELLFLKDGSILKGSVVEETASSVLFKSEKTVRHNRNSILRISYTDTYLGRQYVKKNNGESFLAYIVFEDGENYYFRRVLSSVQEFTLPMDEVMFFCRVHPLNLRARPSEEGVELVWDPPFNRVVEFNVYSDDGSGQFSRIAAVSGCSIIIRGLLPGKKYRFRVTAVDEESVESEFSNTVSSAAGDVIPAPLKIIKLEKREQKNAPGLFVQWKGVDSPLNAGYIIYSETDSSTIKIAETGETFYELKNLRRDKDYYFRVFTAGKENNESSGSLEFSLIQRVFFDIHVTGGVSIPVGAFTDFTSTGYSVLTDVTMGIPGLGGFRFGIKSGYSSLGESDDSMYREHTSVPLYLTLQYGFKIFNLYEMFPYIDSGVAFNRLVYDDNGDSSDGFNYLTEEGMQMQFSAGVVCKYNYSRKNYISLFVQCGIIMESRPKSVVTAGLGFGVKI